MLSAVTAVPMWQETSITGINRLRARSISQVYGSAADALADRKEQVQSLNGQWKFALVDRPEAAPSAFINPDFEDGAWDEVAVPGNFTMQGYVQPNYTNVIMPFDDRPPLVPQENPTGLYRTTFTVPKAWKKKRVILRFGSIDNVGEIWLNGQALGVVKDSRLPSEFDVTDIIDRAVGGENCLALRVLKFSDTSFIEDQDQWWQAGIARDVDLIACNPTYLEDIAATADFDFQNGSGSLDIFVRAGQLLAAGWTVHAQVYDPAGKAFGKEMTEDINFYEGPHDHGGLKIGDTCACSQQFKKVAAWSHEEPNLYTLIVRLCNPKGQEVEAVRVRIGFRHVQCQGRELLLNGQAVLIRGVNRHEHDDRRGKAITRASMRKDVEVLKAHNVNAVRTSHYPPDAYFFDLCDEYGLWCIDEANIETHHYYNDMANDPQYASAFLDRGMRMVLRDRNHPCIFAWSLGNESGYGFNHDAMAGAIRHLDPSRILHYEGAMTCGRWTKGHSVSDLLCPMYPSIASMVAWAKEEKTVDNQRPFITCEFSHAMGNSCGSLSDYWDAIESHHGLQGGFIWEMFDHAIVKATDDGREYWAYGGDFGYERNDVNFVCDGLFFPDRSPHTSMKEAKAIYAPVAVSLNNKMSHEITIHNKHDFISTKHYRMEWVVYIDGVKHKDGCLPQLDIPAGASRNVSLPMRIPAEAQAKLCHIDVHIIDTRESDLIAAGLEVAVCQLALPVMHTPVVALATTFNQPEHQELKIERGDIIRISNDICALEFDSRSGCINHWSIAGVQLLSSGVTDIWRAAIDNDGLKLRSYGREKPNTRAGAKLLRWWLYDEYDRTQRAIDSCKVKKLETGSVQIQWRERTWGRDKAKIIKTQHQFIIDINGTVTCNHRFQITKGMSELPRIGVQFQIPAGFEQMEWFGLGPDENYNDRQSCVRMGRWSSSIADRYVPYIVPQEHGHISDLRELQVCNEKGQGFLLRSYSHCEANLSHYTHDDLYQARHTSDLIPRAESYLNLDAAHRGVGTGACGPDTLERYRVYPGTYHLSYVLSAL